MHQHNVVTIVTISCYYGYLVEEIHCDHGWSRTGWLWVTNLGVLLHIQGSSHTSAFYGWVICSLWV